MNRFETSRACALSAKPSVIKSFSTLASFLAILLAIGGQASRSPAQTLALSLTNAPNTATLTWPLTNFYSVLQSTTNLVSTNSWISEATAAPLPFYGPTYGAPLTTNVTSAGISFASSAVNPQKFYRLNNSFFVPLSSFAIFYNGLLEFTMCETMAINGPVHANGPIYVGSSSALFFNSSVTTTSTLTSPADDGNGPWSTLSSADVTFKSPSQYVTNLPTLSVVPFANTNLHFMIDIPPSSENSMSVTGQLRLYNDAQMLLTVSNPVVGVLNSTNLTVYLTMQTSVNGQVPGADPGKVTYMYTNLSPNYLASGISNRAPNLPFLSVSNWFYDQRELKTNLVTQIDVGQFATWAATNVYVQGKLPSMANVYPTILYVADLRTHDAKHMPVVRLLDGAVLPYNNDYGFSVATLNPLYIWGNYNVQIPGSSGVSSGSTNVVYTVPAALFSDALTILSSLWTDSQSLTKYNNSVPANDATTTTINAAIITGNMPSTGTTVATYSGGVHNLPRLLEDWSDQTLWLNTSFLCLWNSETATNQFRDPQGFSPPSVNPYYNPPTRQFSHNLNYNNPVKTPPGIPVLYVNWPTNQP
jgi:hypothetical protein